MFVQARQPDTFRHLQETRGSSTRRARPWLGFAILTVIVCIVDPKGLPGTPAIGPRRRDFELSFGNRVDFAFLVLIKPDRAFSSVICLLQRSSPVTHRAGFAWPMFGRDLIGCSPWHVNIRSNTYRQNSDKCLRYRRLRLRERRMFR